MAPLKDTPGAAVVNGRVAEYGWFRKPFANLNLLEADVPGVPGFLRKYRLKEWQHFAIITPEFFLGFVVNTVHYMTMSFCYAVDRETGRVVEHHREGLPGAARVSRELWSDTCAFSAKNYRIDVENRLSQGFHRARIDIAASREAESVRADLVMREDVESVQPLIIILPISDNRPLYTHKMVCPIEGELTVGDRRVTLDAARDLALVDVQKTYYPFSTAWRWATCAGYDREGRLIALNLVKNMVPDPETYNENCLWVDGRISRFTAAEFHFDPDRVTAPWRMRTNDGRCSLELQPRGERAGRINLGLIMSDYHAPFGSFSGRVTDDDGQAYDLKDLYGVAEYHRARF